MTKEEFKNTIDAWRLDGEIPEGVILMFEKTHEKIDELESDIERLKMGKKPYESLNKRRNPYDLSGQKSVIEKFHGK